MMYVIPSRTSLTLTTVQLKGLDMSVYKTLTFLLVEIAGMPFIPAMTSQP